jgi:hypothetical protein
VIGFGDPPISFRTIRHDRLTTATSSQHGQKANNPPGEKAGAGFCRCEGRAETKGGEEELQELESKEFTENMERR